MTIIRRYAARGEVSPGTARTPLPAGAPTHRPVLRRLAAAVCLALAATFAGFLGLIPTTAAHAEPIPDPAGAASGFRFDAGDIISDSVFYDTGSMTQQQVRDFIRDQGADCTGSTCLADLRLTTPDEPADRYCAAYPGGVQEDAAAILWKVSTACGISPQVMLVTLQKESGLLTRTDVTGDSYAAAFGWHCPDTGPGGTANCDPQHAGFFNQGYGMAKQWARYRLDPDRYNYRTGQTVNILWNVAESGCGSAPVTIANTATASLYNYTPYQPNAAALASYPGPGDSCSAYGNRNFSYLFQRYFGSPHRDGASITPVVTAAATPAALPDNPVTVTIPEDPNVAAELAGQTITAPNPAIAAGLRAGFQAIGLPYVWGGGGSGAGPDNGCGRGGGQFNSCGATVGFDCSGLTAYVLGQAGYRIPDNSGTQRSAGVRVGWDQALPGDVVGFPGHVAVYLGSFGGHPYILEASWVGTPIHIVPLTRTDADPQLYRYWTGPAAITPTAVDFSAIVSTASAASPNHASWSTGDAEQSTGRPSWHGPAGRSGSAASGAPRTPSSVAASGQAPAEPSVAPPPSAPTVAGPTFGPSVDSPPAQSTSPASDPTTGPPAGLPVENPPVPVTPPAGDPTTAPPTSPAEAPAGTETGADAPGTGEAGTGESGENGSGAPDSGGDPGTVPAGSVAAPPAATEQPSEDAPEPAAPAETPPAPVADHTRAPATESSEPEPDPAPAAPPESRQVIEATPPPSNVEEPPAPAGPTTTAGPPTTDENSNRVADTTTGQQ